jgi:hypothetical protein
MTIATLGDSTNISNEYLFIIVRVCGLSLSSVVFEKKVVDVCVFFEGNFGKKIHTRMSCSVASFKNFVSS